jgi:hypothetical protein
MPCEIWAAWEDEYETSPGWYAATPELVLQSLRESEDFNADDNHAFTWRRLTAHGDEYEVSVRSRIEYPDFKWDRDQTFRIYKIEVRTS